MPYIISLLGGAGIAYVLIESGYAVEALIAFLIFCTLLWVAPQLALYFAALIIALSILAVAIIYWEFVAAIALGCFLFLFFVGGLLHAIQVWTR